MPLWMGWECGWEGSADGMGSREHITNHSLYSASSPKPINTSGLSGDVPLEGEGGCALDETLDFRALRRRISWLRTHAAFP